MPHSSIVPRLQTVTIARKDSTSPVVFKRVRHVWWQNNGKTLVLSRGERGVDRSYVHWPVETIDHIHIEED